MTITLETTVPSVETVKAITEESLRGDVNQFLLGSNCSPSQRKKWADNYNGEASKEILLRIKDRNVLLAEKLEKFTPHESCQLSFIRDVLLQRRKGATA